MKMDNTIKIIAKEIKKKNIPKYSNVQNNNFIVQSNKLSFFFIIIISFWIKVLGFPTAVPHIASNLFPLDTFVKRKSRKKTPQNGLPFYYGYLDGIAYCLPIEYCTRNCSFFLPLVAKACVFSLFYTLPTSPVSQANEKKNNNQSRLDFFSLRALSIVSKLNTEHYRNANEIVDYFHHLIFRLVARTLFLFLL